MSQYSVGRVPESLLNARGIPIESAGSAKEVADRVRQGKAFLEVIETPWGVEFYIVEVGRP